MSQHPPSKASMRPPAADAAVRATAPLVARVPVVLETAGWDDYRLLDMGAGRKLERYGRYVIDRPEPQALGSRRLPAAVWEKADAIFTGDKEEEGPGRWQMRTPLGETWPMRMGDVEFLGRFTSFRHVGLFPEQETHWTDACQRLAARDDRPRVLNLFGYTGLASLLTAAAGAQVTHVDASKKAIGWGRENQAIAGMDALPIRWICEDAMKFAERETRRGNRYEGILLDPPKFGRGPNGEVWDVFRDLPRLLELTRQLVSERPSFVVLTVYAMRASFVAFHELMAEVFGPLGGTLQSGELWLREEPRAGLPSRALSTSLYCRWTPGTQTP